AKLESLGLDCDVIEDLFDVLDADGSDDVSEAEMLNGVEILLELAKGLLGCHVGVSNDGR
ncbi:unnamed protein product, partial [Symbiodinium pilosum]